MEAVSYTHLDVYKRQVKECTELIHSRIDEIRRNVETWSIIERIPVNRIKCDHTLAKKKKEDFRRWQFNTDRGG